MAQILKVKEVSKEVNISVPQIYRLAMLGEFPKPLKLGKRSSGWLQSEIEQWIQEKVDARKVINSSH
jgi:prophage regulatory protein